VNPEIAHHAFQILGRKRASGDFETVLQATGDEKRTGGLDFVETAWQWVSGCGVRTAQALTKVVTPGVRTSGTPTELPSAANETQIAGAQVPARFRGFGGARGGARVRKVFVNKVSSKVFRKLLSAVVEVRFVFVVFV
jgi:Zn-dependent M28 family amino/carboxypeptidase